MLTRREMLALAGLAVVPGFAPSLLGQTAPTSEPKATKMLERIIPFSKASIPAIGMGTWQTFDERPDDAEAMKRLAEVLKIFHDAGGRLIDTSPMYGKSEEVAGTLSSKLGINDSLFIATKVWIRGEKAGVDQMADSTAKLGRKKLELMQIHNLLDWQTHLKTLRAMKEDGRIKYIGITHYQRGAFDDLEKILKTEKPDFIQLPYSVDFRDAEARLIPAAKDAGAAVLVMRPFGGGGLFEKVKGKPVPDHVKPYAATWAQAFLKFLLANETITAVLPATSKPHHMQDNTAAGTGPLPDAAQRKQLIESVA